MTNERYQKIPMLPIHQESTHHELKVEGELPRELDGLYVRNGPNHMGEISPRHHYFSGHGMVHGVRLREGKALWYRNRVVRGGDVAPVMNEKDIGGPILHGIDASPNTNVVTFGHTMYATIEAGASMVEMDEYLSSIRRSTLNGALEFGFTGHH
ncbi:MAG: carotenoid oxygenase family protein, partial [Bacteroidota bacterium]